MATFEKRGDDYYLGNKIIRDPLELSFWDRLRLKNFKEKIEQGIKIKSTVDGEKKNSSKK